MSRIPDEAIRRAKEMFHQPANWGIATTGSFWSLNEEGWDSGCDRMVDVKSVMLERSAIMDATLEDAGWIVPLLAQMGPMHLSHLPIVDVGCGASTFLWDGYLRGIRNLMGIDMSCFQKQFPPECGMSQCQVLDLSSVREALRSTSFPIGGLMVCTEMLEHMEFNPLPGMLLIVEKLKPRYLYVTVPTSLNNDNRVQWMHYADLPVYRGQRIMMPPWHYKGWATEELVEFCWDLGFRHDGMFGGFSRIGFLGTAV